MSLLYPANDDEDPKRAARRPLLAFILVTLAVGALASLFSEPSIPTWYAGLRRPTLSPPNWVFAPVWTALYVMMAVAAARVWHITGLNSAPLIAYGIQLALNFAWSGIFFGLHRIDLALIEIAVLDVAILTTTLQFFRHDRVAGLLMLPYLSWTLFATVLTHAFWTLNP